MQTSDQRKPTMRDVAARAGVSKATVSYVLNGRQDQRIPAATQRRVWTAARQLAYSPNQSARSLSRGRTERVCLVIGAAGVPSFEQLARDLQDVADHAGYGVITIVVDSAERASKAVSYLHQQIADGALISAAVPHIADQTLIDLARRGLPLVVMNNTVTPDGLDVVRTPERTVCSHAFDHLVETGRRRIAFVGHHNETEAGGNSGLGRERREAYLLALKRHRLRRDPQLIVSGAGDRLSSYQTVTELMRHPDPPDAVFVATDRAAIGAMTAIHDAGYTIPDDVAVIGVGNIDDGLLARPTLSTVGPTHHDYTDVARLLFERLHTNQPSPGRTLTVPWSFIHRASA